MGTVQPGLWLLIEQSTSLLFCYMHVVLLFPYDLNVHPVQENESIGNEGS